LRSDTTKAGRIRLRPRHRRAELRCPDQLVVQFPGLGGRPELAEQDASEKPGIGGRDRAGLLGGEDDLMTGVAQDRPRYRDLGDVEIPVRKGQQHAHPAIMALGFTVRRRRGETEAR
jgi:hypothetical protein